MGLVFLDASAIIYLLEGDKQVRTAGQEVLAELRRQPQPTPLAVSELSRLECRVRPLRQANEALLGRYDAFFSDPGLVVLALDSQVLDRAAQLRAHYGLKAPDALQAASLLVHGNTGWFITGDGDFRAVAGMRVRRIKP